MEGRQLHRAACAVPNCQDNLAVMQRCCVGGNLTTFNHTAAAANVTITAEYLTCAVSGSATRTYDKNAYNASDPYQQYQDCLVRGGATRLSCNDPPMQYAGCFPGDYSLTMPGGIAGGGFQSVCVVNTNNENATGTLASCCAGSNGTVRAELYGCEASCSGDASVVQCLRDSTMLPPNRGNFPWLCQNYTDGKGSGASAVGGPGRAGPAGVLVLSIAFTALLL